MDRITINKSLRAIWRNKKSYFSGIFVLIVGLGMYIGFVSAYLLYMDSVHQYHVDTNFADVFASVRTMPHASVDRLTRIDGVTASQGSLVSVASARLDGFSDIIGVLLIGVDDSRPMNINQMTVVGEPILTDNDILVSSSFFDAHDLSIGDTIRILMNGRYETFTIRGTALHPEYLFAPTVSGGMGDDVNTVGFVQLGVVETHANMQGAFNGVRLTLDELTTFADVERELTDAMERYGLVQLVPRERHSSFIGLVGQSMVFSMMGTMFPPMLLAIAVGMLYITLKRIITLERTEIGTMKAMGFTGRHIVSGYLIQGVLASLLSFVLAVPFGWVTGGAFYNLIAEVIDLAWKPYTLHTGILISAFFISLAASLVGVLMGARSSLNVQPAEAMREALPTGGSKGSKFNGFISRLILNTGGKIGLRSMQRNKRRVAITVISIATIFTIMNTFFTMGQTIATLNEDMFHKIQVRDGTINLNRNEPRDALVRHIEQIPGVLEVEAFLTMPVDLSNNGTARTLSIQGIAADSNMFNIFDNNGTQLRTDSGGIILSTFFADELGLSLGDMVTVSHNSLPHDAYVELTQVVTAAVGVGAYMEISELSMIFGSKTIANWAMINVEDGYLPIIFDQLADAGNISGLADSERGIAFARENSEVNNNIFNIINFVAVLLCFAVIYNISNIALGEKQREYATLRVLGFQAPAVTEINTFEYVIMLIMGTALGILISYFNIPAIGAMFSFEQGILNPQISFMPTLMTFIGVAASVAFSCFLTGRQVRKFNLVDTLKER